MALIWLACNQVLRGLTSPVSGAMSAGHQLRRSPYCAGYGFDSAMPINHGPLTPEPAGLSESYPAVSRKMCSARAQFRRNRLCLSLQTAHAFQECFLNRTREFNTRARPLFISTVNYPSRPFQLRKERHRSPHEGRRQETRQYCRCPVRSELPEYVVLPAGNHGQTMQGSV